MSDDWRAPAAGWADYAIRWAEMASGERLSSWGVPLGTGKGCGCGPMTFGEIPHDPPAEHRPLDFQWAGLRWDPSRGYVKDGITGVAVKHTHPISDPSCTHAGSYRR